MPELDFEFFTDVGGWEQNEDCYLAKRLPGGGLFVVADGLGGHRCGEVASRIAVDTIKNASGCGAPLADAVQAANEAVLWDQTGERAGMKTTAAAVRVTDAGAETAHVGDTRIYALQNGKIVFQSRDHSASQLAVAVGEIRPEELRSHPDRNVLTRALGAGRTVRVETTDLPAGRFDSLLLCSDGFWEYVLEDEMERTRRETQTADRWLYEMRQLQLRRRPEGCDNSTAIAVLLPPDAAGAE